MILRPRPDGLAPPALPHLALVGDLRLEARLLASQAEKAPEPVAYRSTAPDSEQGDPLRTYKPTVQANVSQQFHVHNADAGLVAVVDHPTSKSPQAGRRLLTAKREGC